MERWYNSFYKFFWIFGWENQCWLWQKILCLNCLLGAYFDDRWLAILRMANSEYILFMQDVRRISITSSLIVMSVLMCRTCSSPCLLFVGWCQVQFLRLFILGPSWALVVNVRSCGSSLDCFLVSLEGKK